MAALKTTDVTLPAQIVDGIVTKAKLGSAVAALSNREPMRFGDVTIVTFDDTLRAEWVEQSAPKTEESAVPSAVTAVPHKAVVNFRTSDEFLWAEEDYQLGILDLFEQECAIALARALDLGLFHRLNPRTGTVVAAWTNYLTTTTKRVEITGTSAPDTDIEAAVGLVIGAGYPVTGIAFDRSYAWTVSTARYTDGRKKYPDLGFGQDVQNFEGIRAYVSDTVSGRPEAADTKDRAFVGDWTNGVRWGVQRTLPFRMLQYGDPDNTGRDLAGHNEVLFRTEVVYAWYVFTDRFALVEDAV